MRLLINVTLLVQSAATTCGWQRNKHQVLLILRLCLRTTSYRQKFSGGGGSMKGGWGHFIVQHNDKHSAEIKV